MSERHAKGLCYFCDEPYSFEHSRVHKKLQIHVIEVEDDVDLQEVDGNTATVSNKGGDSPHISVNALTGVPSFKTMRITGYKNKKPLHILIDRGSTHNFLDANMATQLGCTMTNPGRRGGWISFDSHSNSQRVFLDHSTNHVYIRYVPHSPRLLQYCSRY